MPGLLHLLSNKLALLLREKWYHIVFVPPCYWIRDTLNENSVVVDCGTGDDADFSQYLIHRFGVRVIGFEPTRKHHLYLDQIVKETGGKFSYFEYALSADKGSKVFYESRQNVSGSVFNDHSNIKHDDCVTYEVDLLNITGIFDLVGLSRIDLLKLDVEGEEYDLLEEVEEETLAKITQIVVEFHHHCIDRYSWNDTHKVVERLRQSGFSSYTRDSRNYLFWRY